MASQDPSSKLPCPPESPEAQGESMPAQSSALQVPTAAEHNPQPPPELAETTNPAPQATIPDAASVQDTTDEDVNNDDDAESVIREPEPNYPHAPHTYPSPLHAGPYSPFPNEIGYPNPPSEAGSRISSRGRGRGKRRNRRGGRGAAQKQQQQQQDYRSFNGAYHQYHLYSAYPQAAAAYGAQPLGQSVNGTFPPGAHSASSTIPYTAYPNRGGGAPTPFGDVAAAAPPGKGQGGSGKAVPAQEHPVQVPVRVVNPSDISEGKKGGNLRLKLDLNLDFEITLKACIKGEE